MSVPVGATLKPGGAGTTLHVYGGSPPVPVVCMPTVVLISHDSEVANHVDAVYYLRDGRIVRSERFDAPVLAVVDA